MALVVFAHAGWTPPPFSYRFFSTYHPGSFGVRLFFVLSGFLITGILVAARAEAEHVGYPRSLVWRAFLYRRALRILPLAYVGLGVAWLLGAPAMRALPWWYLGYLSNALPVLHYPDRSGVGHFWSLAVEEHFYIVWPIVMLFVPTRLWRPLLLVLVVLACPIRILTANIWDPTVAYESTWSRYDALALGGLLAIANPSMLLMLMIALGVLLASLSTVEGSALWMGVHESALVCLTGVIVLAVARGWASRWLSARPLVYVGMISYGIYVWHPMVSGLLRTIGLPVPAAPGPLLLVVVASLSVGLATLSWYAFERPLNSLKREYPYIDRMMARAAIVP